MFAYQGSPVFIFGLSTLIATLASFILGWLWYGSLFGKTWMAHMNIKQADIKKSKQKSMTKSALLNFIGTLIAACVLTGILTTYSLTLGNAMCLTFFLWLAFYAATTHLGTVIWESKPMTLFWINSLYWLASLELMTLIITAWM